MKHPELKSVVAVRLSRDLAKDVRELARADDRPPSSWLRAQLRRLVREAKEATANGSR